MEIENKDDIIKGIISACKEMLNNDKDLLTGCHEVTGFYHKGVSMGIFHDSDDDFSIFRGIESETDNHERSKLIQSGMNENQVYKEFQDTVEYYRNDIINGCKEMISKLENKQKFEQKDG